MGRAGIVSEPVPGEPGRRSPRYGWRRLLTPLIVGGAVLFKVAGSLKFLGIFISVGGYALIWGWRFAVGFVLLILIHELGPYVELQASPRGVIFDAAFTARRQGMDTTFNAAQTVGTKIEGTIDDPSDKDRGWVSEWVVPWKSIDEAASG